MEYNIPSLNDDTSTQIGNLKIKQLVYGIFFVICILVLIIGFFAKVWWMVVISLLFAAIILWFGIHAYTIYQCAVEGLDKYLIEMFQYRLLKKDYELMIYSVEQDKNRG